jgi:pyruvate-ferredoxin/flavodoxin oxidoreductase
VKEMLRNKPSLSNSGYWHLYRFNPDLKKDGKNPFTLDSKTPTADLKEFLLGEARFASLFKKYPDRAERLFKQAKKEREALFEFYQKLDKGL